MSSCHNEWFPKHQIRHAQIRMTRSLELAPDLKPSRINVIGIIGIWEQLIGAPGDCLPPLYFDYFVGWIEEASY